MTKSISRPGYPLQIDESPPPNPLESLPEFAIILSRYGITRDELLSKSRVMYLVEPKFFLTWILSKKGFSISEIGRLTGVGHSAVIHRLNSITEQRIAEFIEHVGIPVSRDDEEDDMILPVEALLTQVRKICRRRSVPEDDVIAYIQRDVFNDRSDRTVSSFAKRRRGLAYLALNRKLCAEVVSFVLKAGYPQLQWRIEHHVQKLTGAA